jgi:predicted transcriptional regulator
MKRKFTVEFNDDIDLLLGNLADKQGLSKAQAIRRAIILMDFFDKEAEKGHKVGVANDDGKLIREIVL